MSDIILEVKDLGVHFRTDDGLLKAVNGISYTLKKGEMLGIVGESASGKSVSSMALMGLNPKSNSVESGEALFHGDDILKMNENELRTLRGNRISMIFQDPMTSLNPFLRISTQMMETYMFHQGMDKKQAYDESVEMLRKVGIASPERRIRQYPHQFSGGMKQRVMIAMALACKPEILIADEPTTALDVTIQAQILELIKELAREQDTAVLLITHDLGVVAGICDTISVMYAGRIVERADAATFFKNPDHPYSKGLINSVPRPDQVIGELYAIPGQPPNVIALPDCCPFHDRCDKVLERCKKAYPPQTVLLDGGEEMPDHTISCWLYGDDKGDADE